VVVVALFAGATAYLFVWPPEDALPRRADAIVVLSGGGNHRLEEGLRLWRAGVAPMLAISEGMQPGWEEANRLCGRRGVRCFHPEPYSTQGEARWIGREAGRRGWEDVVFVTSTYHLRRARMIIGRCFERGLAAVAADPPTAHFAIGVFWEWPKSVYYLALNRGC